jgi:hypothetical protein
MFGPQISNLNAVQGKKQADWDVIAERIHRAGEHGTPLHFKIKAYHVDLAHGDVERPGMILEQVAALAIPRASYLRDIDPDGTRPFEDVKKEIKEQASRYYHLVMNPYWTKGREESAQHGVVVAMDQIMLALLINNRGGDAALWEGRSSRQGSSWMLLV